MWEEKKEYSVEQWEVTFRDDSKEYKNIERDYKIG